MGKTITQNKKAYFNYEILEKFEAGIVLRGSEIKAIRAGKINLQGAHARIMKSANSRRVPAPTPRHGGGNGAPTASVGELFLINANIQTLDKEDNTRTRKLLMHRKEIDKLIGQTQQKGLTLLPISLYIKKGRAKVELALGRGKKLHDKRETLKKKDLDREMR